MKVLDRLPSIVWLTITGEFHEVGFMPASDNFTTTRAMERAKNIVVIRIVIVDKNLEFSSLFLAGKWTLTDEVLIR